MSLDSLVDTVAKKVIKYIDYGMPPIDINKEYKTLLLVEKYNHSLKDDLTVEMVEEKMCKYYHSLLKKELK